MERLLPISPLPGGMLYKIETQSPLSLYVATTADSRAICNDPFVLGINYSESLKRACTGVLKALKEIKPFPSDEKDCVVLHLLRGGLSFGLREALYHAYSWTGHASAFLSAQRVQRSDKSGDWYVKDNEYLKVFLPHRLSLIFADVVATGVSLEYGISTLFEQILREGKELRSVTFFTIGGARTEEILRAVDTKCRENFANYEGTSVIYFEGRFRVASTDSNLSIQYPDTDLLRLNALLAPEFVESQYEFASYPLERCTIYDAGSRAFWTPDYIEDVRDYWEKTQRLAERGLTFEQLLSERFPELNSARFGKQDLVQISREQIKRANQMRSSE